MENNNLKLAKFLFVMIFVVIIIGISLLIFIWVDFFKIFDDNSIDMEELKVGEIPSQKYDEQYAVSKYLLQMNTYFESADIDKLYDILSNDYKEYYSCNKENLFAILKGKNVFGKKFNLTGYASTIINSNRIYSLNLSSEDLSTSLSMNIIEESPNIYKFTLDEFIMNRKMEKTQTINGVNLLINNVIYFNNKIVANTVLTNSNVNSIYLNVLSKTENIFFRSSNMDYVTEATIFSGKSKELTSNSDISLRFETNIGFSSLAAMKKLVIKDVRLSLNAPIIELEYEI